MTVGKSLALALTMSTIFGCTNLQAGNGDKNKDYFQTKTQEKKLRVIHEFDHCPGFLPSVPQENTEEAVSETLLALVLPKLADIGINLVEKATKAALGIGKETVTVNGQGSMPFYRTKTNYKATNTPDIELEEFTPYLYSTNLKSRCLIVIHGNFGYKKDAQNSDELIAKVKKSVEKLRERIASDSPLHAHENTASELDNLLGKHEVIDADLIAIFSLNVNNTAGTKLVPYFKIKPAFLFFDGELKGESRGEKALQFNFSLTQPGAEKTFADTSYTLANLIKGASVYFGEASYEEEFSFQSLPVPQDAVTKTIEARKNSLAAIAQQKKKVKEARILVAEQVADEEVPAHVRTAQKCVGDSCGEYPKISISQAFTAEQLVEDCKVLSDYQESFGSVLAEKAKTAYAKLKDANAQCRLLQHQYLVMKTQMKNGLFDHTPVKVEVQLTVTSKLAKWKQAIANAFTDENKKDAVDFIVEKFTPKSDQTILEETNKLHTYYAKMAIVDAKQATLSSAVPGSPEYHTANSALILAKIEANNAALDAGISPLPFII